MLKLTVAITEQFDDEKEEFIYSGGTELHLEHSLVSISKWESKYCKPFLTRDDKTFDETIDYIRFMTVNEIADPDIYTLISESHIREITAYIESPMTATVVNLKGDNKSHEVMTSEVIYYMMIALTIPFECQYWHLNRLITLINVCNIKNAPKKKMSRKEIMQRNSALNAARLKALNTTG